MAAFLQDVQVDLQRGFSLRNAGDGGSDGGGGGVIAHEETDRQTETDRVTETDRQAVSERPQSPPLTLCLGTRVY